MKYGEKRLLVEANLRKYTGMPDYEIADNIGCTAQYVGMIRRKMQLKSVEEPTLPLDFNDAPTQEELTPAELDEVLETAAILSPDTLDGVLAERGARYGVFLKHALITQRLKAVMADTPNWVLLDDDMVEALEMVAHKIGRVLNGDPSYADSWVDIAGYAQLVADRLNGKVH